MSIDEHDKQIGDCFLAKDDEEAKLILKDLIEKQIVSPNTKLKLKSKLSWEKKMQYTKIGLMIVGLIMFGIFLLK